MNRREKKDVESGEQRQLVDLPERFEYEPRWSPDGSTLAFTAATLDHRELVPHERYDGDRDIFVATDGGRVVIRVTHDGVSDGPVWSPDSAWIAYSSGDDETRAMVVRADGSDRARLMADRNVMGVRPVSWAEIGD